MTEQDLKEIERVNQGEDWPGDLWFIETIEKLVAEVRRLSVYERRTEVLSDVRER